MSVARRLSEFIEDIEEFSTYFEWSEVLSDYLSKKGDKSTSVINSYRTQIIQNIVNNSMSPNSPIKKCKDIMPVRNDHFAPKKSVS